MAAKITLPCGHKIEPKELLSIAGKYSFSLRKSNPGGTGRPRTLPRCTCGKYSLKRKPKSHVC